MRSSTVSSPFEPVRGSAPDIADKGIANPMGTVWAGAMMLEHLGAADAEAQVMDALARDCADAGALTGDLGGRASTREVGDAVIAALLH